MLLVRYFHNLLWLGQKNWAGHAGLSGKQQVDERYRNNTDKTKALTEQDKLHGETGLNIPA